MKENIRRGERPLDVLKRWRTEPDVRTHWKEKGEAVRRARRDSLTVKIEVPYEVLLKLAKEFEVRQFDIELGLNTVLERLGENKEGLAYLLEKEKW